MPGFRFAPLTFLILTLFPGAGAKLVKTYAVRIPNLRITAHESIVSFEVDVTAGAIRSVSSLPVGWYVVVDNDASWQTKVMGNTTVGAASLKAADLAKIRLVVDRNELMDLKFQLRGVVSVTEDYVKERRIEIQRDDFSLTPAR